MNKNSNFARIGNWLWAGRIFRQSLRLVPCLAIAGCLFFAACLMPQPSQVMELSGPTLSPRTTVYVAIPPDAYDASGKSGNSGRQTAALIRDAFTIRAARVHFGRRNETLALALESARRLGSEYCVYPTILRWEEHATEISGLRDKIEVKIEIADITSGKITHRATFKGTGAWMTTDADNPMEIVKEAIAEYVAGLFRGQ